jgi:hypothetical protein
VPELLNWFGLPASIAVAFTAIFGLFLTLEKVASTTKKAELSSFLRSADWSVLPLGLTATIREGFDAIFGEDHFSAKCFKRSVQFSLFAVVTLLALGFLNHYSYFKTMPGQVLYHRGYKYIFFGWLLWSVFFDYFNLYKTRLIIRLIDKKELSVFIFLFLVAFDLSISFVVFVVSQNFLDVLNMVAQLCFGGICSIRYETGLSISMFQMSNHDPDGWSRRLFLVTQGPIANEVAVFFWSGLLPTLWLLMYISATTLTRWLVKNADLISFTISWLNVDKPFEMIGFVAASMVSMTMVVYGLVSKII